MMNWNALIFLRDGIKNLSFLLVIKRKIDCLEYRESKKSGCCFYIQKTSETVNRPEKAIEVVKLLDEISKVLIEYGVDERCLRLL